MKKFFNLSNHPSHDWSEKQIKAIYGIAGSQSVEIVDIPFPIIDPATGMAAVKVAVDRKLEPIMQASLKGKCVGVLLQGEFTFTVCAVSRLIIMGIPVYSATSHREKEELPAEDERRRFCFVRFRRYEFYM